ncbi:PDZ domain-containing protein [Flavobacterium branchiicola]|uniref:PDZ domain-containing protein n=1 Tax=Flavobacterium branchiicola TaxID=1114875 RepID=A0ABV9PDJ9_9FLAO|nr:PDZ domain-containing protein [Flavobacterium branchiicola]MBS7254684.1 PDZ domain-containing protein [Flavobacterium branchiicola]
MLKNYLKLTLALFIFNYHFSFAQCTPAKDSEMAKYERLSQTQDPQGCAQCGMLALYFCSAKYCVKSEDVSKVGTLISACKQNIINMGQPYCCPDYLNKEPEWGIMGEAPNATSSGKLGGVSNPAVTGNDASTANLLANSAVLIGSLLDSGSTSGASNLSSLNSYVQGQQLAEATTAIIDLFSASPEQKAKKEQERIAAEKRAEEYRKIELQKKIENENNAKIDFQKTVLQKLKNTDEVDRSNIVIWGMDNYISDKYNYDVRDMIPEWKTWMNQSVQNNNKFVSTVFAGKTLGLNFNKFNYDLGLTTDQAIQILEKIANSETEYRTYLGISWDIEKKTIKTKSKKKTISKDILSYKIDEVFENTAALSGGLQKGDIVLKINNNYIDNIDKLIRSFKPGDKIDLTFTRNNKEYTKNITLGSVAKDNHNVEAMIILANYFNTKAKGNNPEKALYYFTKAAENGSPNAMYALGEIYQKNIFGDKKLNVKYKFKKNEEFAMEWYHKSILNTNYTASLLHQYYKNGTYFEPKAFDELITMYKKGIGCEKNIKKSEEIAEIKKTYTDQFAIK